MQSGFFNSDAPVRSPAISVAPVKIRFCVWLGLIHYSEQQLLSYRLKAYFRERSRALALCRLDVMDHRLMGKVKSSPFVAP